MPVQGVKIKTLRLPLPLPTCHCAVRDQRALPTCAWLDQELGGVQVGPPVSLKAVDKGPDGEVLQGLGVWNCSQSSCLPPLKVIQICDTHSHSKPLVHPDNVCTTCNCACTTCNCGNYCANLLSPWPEASPAKCPPCHSHTHTHPNMRYSPMGSDCDCSDCAPSLRSPSRTANEQDMFGVWPGVS